MSFFDKYKHNLFKHVDYTPIDYTPIVKQKETSSINNTQTTQIGGGIILEKSSKTKNKNIGTELYKEDLEFIQACRNKSLYTNQIAPSLQIAGFYIDL